MALQTVQETVTVTAEAPVVETTRSEVASVVTQEQIESLPIANRQPISLALLLPGTSMDMTSVRRAQANIGAGGRRPDEPLSRRRRHEHVEQLRPAAPRGAAVGDPGIQGQHQAVVGGIRRRSAAWC